MSRRACWSASSSTAARTRSTCSSPLAIRSTGSYRPRLGLSAEGATPFAEDGRLFWHPSLAGLATLHGEGKVSVLPGVGYTGANQSHFTSRHYWEVGATNDALRTGWLGRYLDRIGAIDNPLQGVSLDNRLQPALATAKVPIASIDGPDRYDFWTRGVWGEVADRLLDAVGALGSLPVRRRRRARRRRRRRTPVARAVRPGSRRSGREDGKTPSLGTPVPVPVHRRRLPAPARRPGGHAGGRTARFAASRSPHRAATTRTTTSLTSSPTGSS